MKGGRKGEGEKEAGDKETKKMQVSYPESKWMPGITISA